MLKAHVHEENENIAVELEFEGTSSTCRLDAALLVLAMVHRMTEETVARVTEEYKKENPGVEVTNEMITAATDMVANDQLSMLLETIAKVFDAKVHKQATTVDVSFLVRLRKHLNYTSESNTEQSVDTNEQEEENNA